MKRLLYGTCRTSRSSRHSAYMVRLQWQRNPTCTQYLTCHVWHRDWAYAHPNSPSAYGSVVILETCWHMIMSLKYWEVTHYVRNTPNQYFLDQLWKTNPSCMKHICVRKNIINPSTVYYKSNIFVLIISQAKIPCPPGTQSTWIEPNYRHRSVKYTLHQVVIIIPCQFKFDIEPNNHQTQPFEPAKISKFNSEILHDTS